MSEICIDYNNRICQSTEPIREGLKYCSTIRMKNKCPHGFKSGASRKCIEEILENLCGCLSDYGGSDVDSVELVRQVRVREYD